MTSENIIKKILNSEEFKQLVEKVIENTKAEKTDEKRVYCMEENLNYPLSDFKFKSFVNSSYNEVNNTFKKNFDNYKLIEKNETGCIISAYDDENKENLNYHNIFICEYIGENKEFL